MHHAPVRVGDPVTPEQMKALREFYEHTRVTPYPKFPEGKIRDELRRLGMIERWNPSLKATGRIKPWRITEKGYWALTEKKEDN